MSRGDDERHNPVVSAERGDPLVSLTTHRRITRGTQLATGEQIENAATRTYGMKGGITGHYA